MHPSHEPREAPKQIGLLETSSTGGRQAQCRDGLARRQAGALAEKNFRLCVSIRALPRRTLSAGREDKRPCSGICAGIVANRTCHSVVWNSPPSHPRAIAYDQLQRCRGFAQSLSGSSCERRTHHPWLKGEKRPLLQCRNESPRRMVPRSQGRLH